MAMSGIQCCLYGGYLRPGYHNGLFEGWVVAVHTVLEFDQAKLPIRPGGGKLVIFYPGFQMPCEPLAAFVMYLHECE